MRRPGRSGELIIVAFALALVSASDSVAGPMTHDGFFARASLGGSHAETSIQDSRGDVKLSGESVRLYAAIGWAVTPSLALHATVFSWSTEPDVEIDGEGAPPPGGELELLAIGAGFTYYVLPEFLFPLNFYVSPSVGVAELSIPDGDAPSTTDRGFAADLTLGVERWVASRWSLGLVGAIDYHVVPGSGTDEDWTGLSYAYGVVATFD